jgi:hypothetical protein
MGRTLFARPPMETWKAVELMLTDTVDFEFKDISKTVPYSSIQLIIFFPKSSQNMVNIMRIILTF